MSTKRNHWCAVTGCMNMNVEKRHFFGFPKEYDRWLLWVKACGRLDLITKGLEYTHRNCRLCHIHFEEKWYEVKGRARLNRDAIPTRFFRPNCNYNSDLAASIILSFSDNSSNLSKIVSVDHCYAMSNNENVQLPTTNAQGETNRTTSTNIEMGMESRTQPTCEENFNSGLQLSRELLPVDMVAEFVELNTSGTCENTSRKKRLRTKNMKLKAEVKMLREMIKQLRKERNKQKRKSVDKEETNELNLLQKLRGQLLPPNFFKLLSVQNDIQTKNKHSRRYNSELKNLALLLYFLSPWNYKGMRKTISLPSIRCLQLFTQAWDIVPGLNEKIFYMLSMKLKMLPCMDRHCILCVDEISLKTHLFYNISKDKIIGFEDNGKERSCVPARKALVIMARSIGGNWRLPICYCFVETMCQANTLKSIIFETIIKLKNSGATVHALVTNMGPNFMQLSRDLGISKENCTFLVDQERIIYIFDTLCLLKATRNNLLKHNFLFHNKMASWSHIAQFYARDSKQWIRVAPNLSKCHIEPNSYQKTKVKYAAQVFSNRVAAGICSYMSSGVIPTQAVGTIDLVNHLDKLFDILNSFNVGSVKEYGKVFTGNEQQVLFLNNTMHLLACIKVIDSNGSHVKVTCFKGWQITIKGIIQLWDTLKYYKFPYLRTRRINLGCIENFFNSIRQHSGNRLTPIQFARAFKKLFSIQFLKHPDTQNYATDRDDYLKQIRAPNSVQSMIAEPVLSSTHKILDIPSPDYYTINLLKENTFQYVCEYLIKKCMEIHSCDMCIAYVNVNKTILNDTTLCCPFRAYRNEEGYLFENLHIAKCDLYFYIYKLEEIFVKNMKLFSFQKSIGGHLFHLTQSVIFKPPCLNFPRIFLIKLFLRIRIYLTLSQYNKTCKRINRENRLLLNVSHI